MITDAKISEILANVPSDQQREVASALTASKYSMSASEAAKHYSIPIAVVEEVWNKYGLSNSTKTTGKRKRKAGVIEAFLKENIGKTVTPHDVVKATGISMPTFYNFYNANVGYFKKVKRGQFEIIDPATERNK